MDPGSILSSILQKRVELSSSILLGKVDPGSILSWEMWIPVPHFAGKSGSWFHFIRNVDQHFAGKSGSWFHLILLGKVDPSSILSWEKWIPVPFYQKCGSRFHFIWEKWILVQHFAGKSGSRFQHFAGKCGSQFHILVGKVDHGSTLSWEKWVPVPFYLAGKSGSRFHFIQGKVDPGSILSSILLAIVDPGFTVSSILLGKVDPGSILSREKWILVPFNFAVKSGSQFHFIQHFAGKSGSRFHFILGKVDLGSILLAIVDPGSILSWEKWILVPFCWQ